MGKIGILTFHYSTNFGGVLQAYALYKHLARDGANVEIINFVPSSYSGHKVYRNIGLRRGFNFKKALQRIKIKASYCSESIRKFEEFRSTYMRLSIRVDESTLPSLIGEYDSIVVGSDQVWGPGKRCNPAYFLGYESYKGKRISYAADSTVSLIQKEHLKDLKNWVGAFDHISVRNIHSEQFVKTLTGKNVPIVVDPTLLWDFNELDAACAVDDQPYLLVYVLGQDINGSNARAIKKIKDTYGDLRVYAIGIPTMEFNLCDYADRVFYNLGPEEWVNMIRNAKFVYTDSFHGTLFSLKFHKPFLAYYAMEKRATRFIDLGKRYQIEPHIVTSVDEIDVKKSLLQTPDFAAIDQIIEEHRAFSIRFLEEALGIDG